MVVGELELISANEDEKPALQKMEGALNREIPLPFRYTRPIVSLVKAVEGVSLVTRERKSDPASGGKELQKGEQKW